MVKPAHLPYLVIKHVNNKAVYLAINKIVKNVPILIKKMI